MKNSDYWRKRFEQLEEAQLNKGAAYYADLEAQYKLASKRIEDQISGWYNRFAHNNQITFAEAKVLLNSKELKEFKWTVQEYIKRGKENAVTGQWMKELENASAKVHISRLESLKLQLQQQCEVLYGNQIDGLDKTMRKIYSDGYYHTAYEIQKGFNVGYDLHKMNETQVSAVISKPWAADGKNFINRCWTDKAKLVNTLHTELTQGIIRGDAPDQAIKTIAQKFNTSKANAGRLVMTESAFFASAAQQDCFNDLGVEKYEIVATLDRRTSPTCRHLDGKVFEMKDYKVGTTAPPFHCRCRTVTVPYFDDNVGGSRAARNDDGKTYYVPDSMKYPDWEKSFVDGGSKEGLQELSNNDTIKKKVNAVYQEALTLGRKSGNESLFLINQNGDTVIQLGGSKSHVTFTDEMINILETSTENAFTLIHNHPRSSSFSPEDIMVLNRFKAVKDLGVIGHDSTKYTLDTAGNNISNSEIRTAYSEINKKLWDKYNKAVQDRIMTPDEAWREHSHEILDEMAKKFKWLYERSVFDES